MTLTTNNSNSNSGSGSSNNTMTMRKLELKYESGDKFYDSLPFNSVENQRYKTTNVEKSKASSRIYHVPRNLPFLLKSLDSEEKSCKRSIVSFSIILNDAYNLRLAEKRKIAIQKMKRKAAGVIDVNEQPTPNKKQRKNDGGCSRNNKKVQQQQQQNELDDEEQSRQNRIDCIPTEMYACTSPMAKVAVAMFMFKNVADQRIKKQMICTLSTEPAKFGIKDLVELYRTYRNDGVLKKTFNVGSNVGELEEFYDTLGDASEMFCGTLMRAFLEISDLTRERVYSKFAFDMSYRLYIETLGRYVDNVKFHTITPFEPLMRSYLANNVSKVMKNDEMRKITNYFDHNVADAFKFLSTKTSYLGELEKKKKNAVVIAATKDDKNLKNIDTSLLAQQQQQKHVFDENVRYEVYIGQPNYLKDLIFTFYEHGDRCYKISMYKDCLYDVYCYQSKEKSNGIENGGAFNDMPWSKRLQLIPIRMRVHISEYSGADLNTLSRSFNGTITASYKDEEKDHYCMDTHNTCVKKERKSKHYRISKKELSSNSDNDDDVAAEQQQPMES